MNVMDVMVKEIKAGDVLLFALQPAAAVCDEKSVFMEAVAAVANPLSDKALNTSDNNNAAPSIAPPVSDVVDPVLDTVAIRDKVVAELVWPVVHAALAVEETESSFNIIHALPKKGVLRQSLLSALREFYAKHGAHRVEVLRPREGLRVDDIAALKTAAQAKLGAAYNDIFSHQSRDSQGRKAYYCCQLIRLCYKEALEVEVAPSRVLNFRDSSGLLIPTWTDYFAKRGLAVPEQETGSHPADFRISQYLRTVAHFVIETMPESESP